jgi:hypothetical protein
MGPALPGRGRPLPRRAGAYTFASLFAVESFVRSLNSTVISLQAYDILGAAQKVSMLSTVVSLSVLSATLLLPFLLLLLELRRAVLLPLLLATLLLLPLALLLLLLLLLLLPVLLLLLAFALALALALALLLHLVELRDQLVDRALNALALFARTRQRLLEWARLRLGASWLAGLEQELVDLLHLLVDLAREFLDLARHLRVLGSQRHSRE